MKFYSNEAPTIDTNIQISKLFPIYITKTVETIKNIKNTTIKLSKNPSDNIFAYCDEEKFEIGDMFKHQFEILNLENENFVESKHKNNSTTIKKTKQTNLFNFIRNKE